MTTDPAPELWPALQHDPTLLPDTLAQLAKDMRSNGLDPSWAPNDPMEVILPKLKTAIRSFSEQEAGRFSSLLYTVDVPETRIRAAFATQDPFRAIAELLLMRCLQKVVLRRMFSAGGAMG